MNVIKAFSILLLLFTGIACGAQQAVNIVPLPVNLTTEKGFFTIDNNTSISIISKNRKLNEVCELFIKQVKNISGIQLKNNKDDKADNHISVRIASQNELGKVVVSSPENSTV